LVIPVFLANDADGDVYGFEIAAVWQAARWCRIQASYSFLESDLSAQLDTSTLGGLVDVTLDSPFEGPGPQNQATARASFDLPENVELDLIGRYVDSILERNAGAYVTFDARLAYELPGGLTFSLVGQNLAQNNHREFIEPLLGEDTTKVQRGVYGAITWRY
jgi:iron complex outermembrane receptor protein